MWVVGANLRLLKETFAPLQVFLGNVGVAANKGQPLGVGRHQTLLMVE